MSYNIIIIVLVIYAAVSQIFMLKAVKFGLKGAEKPEKAAEEPVFTLPEKKKEAKVSESEQRILDILGNIDAYDGTSAGQKEIE